MTKPEIKALCSRVRKYNDYCRLYVMHDGSPIIETPPTQHQVWCDVDSLIELVEWSLKNKEASNE